jgi:hypothetical protein
VAVPTGLRLRVGQRFPTIGAPLRIAIAGVALVALAAPSVARADGTIGFDDRSAGEALTNQYAGQGVVFSPCADPGSTPNQVTSTASARSSPNVVTVSYCGAAATSTRMTATFSAAQSRVDVWVRGSSLDQPQPVVMTALDGAAGIVQTASAQPTNSGWTQLSISQPAGEMPRIASVRIERQNDVELWIDDFSFGSTPTGGAGGTSPLPDAVISISPNPTCTGIPTVFDGSASTSPNGPITGYHWIFKPVRRQFFLALALAGFWQAYLFGDTSADLNLEAALEALPDRFAFPVVVPTFTAVPNWNRAVTLGDVGLDPGGARWAFDAVAVKLTVTDSTGVSGSTWRVLVPGQWYDNESRASCPHTPRHKPHFAFAKTTTSVGLAATGAASLEVTCKSRVDCFGTARVLRASGGILAVNGGFTIPAGHRATVTLAPTRAGRALAKRARRQVKARLKLTSVDPLGRGTTRNTAVTLKP